MLFLPIQTQSETDHTDKQTPPSMRERRSS
jgi:hypothetical protein